MKIILGIICYHFILVFCRFMIREMKIRNRAKRIEQRYEK